MKRFTLAFTGLALLLGAQLALSGCNDESSIRAIPRRPSPYIIKNIRKHRLTNVGVE